MTNRKIFLVYDDVAAMTVGYYEAPNAGILIRNNYKYFEKMNPYYKDDWRIFEIGEYTDNGRPSFYTYDNFITHPWSEFNYPEYSANPLDEKEKASLQSQPTGVTGNPPPNL